MGKKVENRKEKGVQGGVLFCLSVLLPRPVLVLLLILIFISYRVFMWLDIGNLVCLLFFSVRSFVCYFSVFFFSSLCRMYVCTYLFIPYSRLRCCV